MSPPSLSGQRAGDMALYMLYFFADATGLDGVAIGRIESFGSLESRGAEQLHLKPQCPSAALLVVAEITPWPPISSPCGSDSSFSATYPVPPAPPPPPSVRALHLCQAPHHQHLPRYPCPWCKHWPSLTVVFLTTVFIVKIMISHGSAPIVVAGRGGFMHETEVVTHDNEVWTGNGDQSAFACGKKKNV